VNDLLASVPEFLGRIVDAHAKGDIGAAASASAELARVLGQLRAQNLLRDDLVRRDNPVIFDVGANVGHFTESYLQLFDGATVHAFEPHPEAFRRLAERFQGSQRVFLNNCGVGDRQGQLLFNISSDMGSSSFLAFSPDSPYVRGIGVSTVEALEVPVVTIDSYCQAKGIEHIDFMKLDVQGFERKVLEGSAEMLARHAIGAIQVEIVFRNFYKESLSFLDIEQCLQAHGYTLRCIYDIYPSEGAQIFQCDAIYAHSSGLT
jgi:FkbM family methyltransferase